MRVNGNIIALLLVSVRGAQLSLTVCLPWTRLVFQHIATEWLRLSCVKFALWNQTIWQWVRLTEISLTYLVNLFLWNRPWGVRSQKTQFNSWFVVYLNQKKNFIASYCIESHCVESNRNRIASLAASYVSSVYHISGLHRDAYRIGLSYGDAHPYSVWILYFILL